MFVFIECINLVFMVGTVALLAHLFGSDLYNNHFFEDWVNIRSKSDFEGLCVCSPILLSMAWGTFRPTKGMGIMGSLVGCSVTCLYTFVVLPPSSPVLVIG